ncbi:SDR family NAD(P)-dependent oxidoreductase [Rhizobium sp. C4]|uniref:SDR family NAD(P)-dependent oxidoreductase n=1 Tax=Rhizobium sp. C4 TaxID=1349800 RepID=UPI001E45C827|nr:SDR family NAD(P)-dependent oxidoreductase [Rhizobium sp. C4]MCD2175775.1 SDR family NAD(P)-dependent oxidoreductase [Rhizobium sp. C4]
MESIFITGAGSGIGKHTATVFAAKGWRVGLADNNGAAAAALAAELGGHAKAYTVDVTSLASIETALADFVGPEGALKAIFNSAGLLEMKPFAEANIDRLNAVFDVNVKGVINSTKAALPYLSRHGDARIITMGSVSGIYGIPDLAVYSSSKFAVRGLTEALNVELEGKGIWVCDLMVAYVKTPMVLEAASKAKSVDILGVNVTPDQVAETVLKAVDGRQVHWFVTPEDAGVATQVDSMPWESRRDFVKQITGY